MTTNTKGYSKEEKSIDEAKKQELEGSQYVISYFFVVSR